MTYNPVFRRLVTWTLVAAVAVGTTLLIRLRYGHFDDFYYVTSEMPQATQLLRVGSDVRMSGVVIGSVSDIELVERHVRLTFQIQPQYKVPADSEAFVELKTLLGDKFVDLRYDRYSGPFLEDGDSVQGNVGPELEDVLQEGVEVFEAINPDDLATIIGELAQGARGHGEDVARGLDANAELSTLFAETVKEQLHSWRDFRLLFGMLKTRAIDLNELAQAVNQGVPVYASERAHQDMRRVLEAIVPMANNFADLLIFDEDAWDRMMDHGDVVLQTIAERPDGLHDLIHGIYRYVFKLGGHPPMLPDGTGMAPFANFIGGEGEEGGGGGGGGGEEGLEEAIHDICEQMPEEVQNEVLVCQVTP
jgi:phospholipid/cholesterol/gamma-HCH transport system substrate-binding protein